MANLYKFFLILALIKSYVGVLGFGEFQQYGESGEQDFDGTAGESPRRTGPHAIKRWRVGYRNRRRGTTEEGAEITQQTPGQAPPKPPRGVPRDFDELLDGSSDDSELDQDIDDEEDIKCTVEARRPYGGSPSITLTGIKERFNSLLIGYDTHSDQKRANKGSLYGWSSPRMPDQDNVGKFTFDIDYASILPQGGTPLSYCALIFVPPVVPKFDMRSVFGKPVMSTERYIASEEHLVKALKKKSRKVTSCCFIAYPIASRR